MELAKMEEISKLKINRMMTVRNGEKTASGVCLQSNECPYLQYTADDEPEPYCIEFGWTNKSMKEAIDHNWSIGIGPGEACNKFRGTIIDDNVLCVLCAAE